MDAMDHYWHMWNETDVSKIRSHLDQAVTEDFIFCDPLHWHVGRDALEDNVRTLRAKLPTARFEIASGIDSHHNRLRYDWHILRKGRLLMQGFDVTTVADSGLIERIDGFFGPLPPREASPDQ